MLLDVAGVARVAHTTAIGAATDLSRSQLRKSHRAGTVWCTQVIANIFHLSFITHIHKVFLPETPLPQHLSQPNLLRQANTTYKTHQKNSGDLCKL